MVRDPSYRQRSTLYILYTLPSEKNTRNRTAREEQAFSFHCGKFYVFARNPDDQWHRLGMGRPRCGSLLEYTPAQRRHVWWHVTQTSRVGSTNSRTCHLDASLLRPGPTYRICAGESTRPNSGVFHSSHPTTNTTSTNCMQRFLLLLFQSTTLGSSPTLPAGQQPHAPSLPH